MIKPSSRESILYEQTFETVLREEFLGILASARSKRIRTYRQFAEEEVRIPEGKHQGERFRIANQPVQGIILDAFEQARKGGFKRFAGASCIQAGKTLIFLVIPVIYHLAEMAETVILAAPNMTMCHDKWLQEIRPIMQSSPNLEWLLPRRGRGSRDGLSESIFLENGACLKFMSAGGNDVKRSGFTSRITVITEVDKMDEGTETSRETNPISQIEHRAAQYGGDNLMIMECTLSYEHGRMWQEYLNGTRHEGYVQCPYCQAWSVPDRSWLFGIDQAQTVIAAMRNGYFACPKCLHRLNEDDRYTMIDGLRLAGMGQTIDSAGNVVGELSETLTYSVRVNAFHNRFWSTGFIAKHSWTVQKAIEHESPLADDLEKEENQFYWTCPHKPKEFGDLSLDPDKIRGRIMEFPLGMIPPDAQRTVLTIDVGKYTGWWMAMCGMPQGKLYIPAYGGFSAPDGGEPHNESGVLSALLEMFENTALAGLTEFGTGEVIHYDKIWIDGGYLRDVVAKVIRKYSPERGPRGRVRMANGRGRSVFGSGSYQTPRRKDLTIRMIGDQWHGQWENALKVMRIYFNADVYKLRVQRAVQTPQEEPGALSFYRPTGHDPRKSEHARLSRHFTNEQFKTVETARGPEKKWIRMGDNHWLDCAAMAIAALTEAGWSMLSHPKDAEETIDGEENEVESNEKDQPVTG